MCNPFPQISTFANILDNYDCGTLSLSGRRGVPPKGGQRTLRVSQHGSKTQTCHVTSVHNDSNTSTYVVVQRIKKECTSKYRRTYYSYVLSNINVYTYTSDQSTTSMFGVQRIGRLVRRKRTAYMRGSSLYVGGVVHQDISYKGFFGCENF